LIKKQAHRFFFSLRNTIRYFLSLIDITPSAPPPPEESNPNSNDSIRRYFERLTLLETIYEKLNMESTKTPVESIDHHHPQKFSAQENPIQPYHPVEKRIETKEEIINHPQTYSSNKSGNSSAK
jgi:hypothetical protein